jgi:regulation of enolase protein 1 (concanavalin A-like superfamily)
MKSTTYFMLVCLICATFCVAEQVQVTVDGSQENAQPDHFRINTFEDFTWFFPPTRFNISDDKSTLTVTSAQGTDLWRKTHYGFIRDNGNFFYYNRPIRSNFTLYTKFMGKYEKLYDQAGIMLRLDEFVWIKCGIEFFNDKIHVSAVVTNNYSDWNVVEIAPEAYKGYMYIKITRASNSITVFFKTEEKGDYKMLRLAHLAVTDNAAGNLPVYAGILVASPTGPGFDTVFTDFALHDGCNDVHFN